MRRFSLGFGGGVGASFTVGETDLADLAGGAFDTRGRIQVSPNAPAPRAGTITQVKYTAQAGKGGTVYFATGKLDTGAETFTVTAITGSNSATAGSNTFTVSLAIGSGDVIGAFTPASGGAWSGINAAGAAWSNNTSLPTPGAVIVVGNDLGFNGVCVQGTGA